MCGSGLYPLPHSAHPFLLHPTLMTRTHVHTHPHTRTHTPLLCLHMRKQPPLHTHSHPQQGASRRHKHQKLMVCGSWGQRRAPTPDLFVCVWRVRGKSPSYTPTISVFRPENGYEGGRTERKTTSPSSSPSKIMPIGVLRSQNSIWDPKGWFLTAPGFQIRDAPLPSPPTYHWAKSPTPMRAERLAPGC